MDMQKSDYDYTLAGNPDFAMARVRMKRGQSLRVEASAMATMSTTLRMRTRLRGGLGRMLTGESLFINDFTASEGDGEIGVAPGSPGDIAHVYLEDEVIYLQNSGFLASAPAVQVESSWQGVKKGFFSGESFFLIRCSGRGDLFFNSYGGIIPIDVHGDYVVDTGHIVAFGGGLQYQVQMLGGYKSLFFSGEGLVCRFTGTGRLWLQTRLVPAFASWIYPFRPQKSSK